MSQVLDSVVREALAELANASYQQRVWLAAVGPEVGSLTEASEQLFDDTGLGDALERRVEVYGSETDEVLRELRVLLAELDIGYPPATLLRDSRLGQVRELARTALRDCALGRDAGGLD